jgi:hypothetical protein
MIRHSRSVRARALTVAGLLVAGMGVTAFTASAAAAQSAVLQPGQTASSGMELLANLPKNGAFAPESAFNSDLAFSGNMVYAGNYNGFTVYDVKNPRKPVQVKQLVCPGSQNDISVFGNLLVLSVDSLRSDDSCTSTGLTVAQAAATGTGYWEGLRIFDISDPANPQYVKAVETDCGSHTHTLVPSADGATVYAYVSSYNPNALLADCQPPHDKISIVEIPVADPTAASVVAEPVLFPDGGLTPRTQGCHDITAYPAKGIAAGACMGEGVMMDISDPVNPVVTERVADTENFAFWHSATFNNDADTVMFTDELGGGGAPTCNPTVGPNKGANAFYTLAGGELTFQSYFKIPREQSDTENCVAHNGSLIPVQGGKDVMVQAWYQGGITVIDFTDPAAPRELAWFDRGPLDADRLVLGGSWSAYYHDGYVFSNDIQKGLDVFAIKVPEAASGKSIRSKVGDYNVQSQPQF